MDKKGFDILLEYKNSQVKDIPNELFQYAENKGYLFKEEIISHDNAIHQLFYEYKKITKRSVTDAFLASLSENKNGWRACLGVYSIMQKFPIHAYTERDTTSVIQNSNPCEVCSSFRNSYANYKNWGNYLRLSSDDFFHDIYNYLFILWEFNNRLSFNIKPQSEDFDLFLNIIRFIKSEKKVKNPSELHKSLIKSKILRLFNGAQVRSLIETLGYCSILTIEKEKGPLYKYINFASAPKKSNRSDWPYPVEFWTGIDGLNKDAFNFWFGDYSELGNVSD
jgi:hypothetical protein